MADFDACLAMDRDAEVTRFIPGPWSEPRAHEAFLRGRIDTAFGDGLGYWSIFRKERPNDFAGWILLAPYDGVGPEIEIGWRLNRAAWGQGFATEAARTIVAHAFRTIGIQRIVAEVVERNFASMRVAEKLGMQLVGDGKHQADAIKCYALRKTDLVWV